MSDALSSTTWQAAVASVAHAYAVAANIGANHPPGTIEEGQFSDAASQIGDAVHALVATPAPDLAAVRLKLNLLAEEFGGADQEHLTAISEDLNRIALANGEFDPARWLADFEAAGGGFVIREDRVVFIVPTVGEIGTVQQLINSLDHCPDNRAAVADRIRASDRNPTTDEGGN